MSAADDAGVADVRSFGPILAAKVTVPPLRTGMVGRRRLDARLANERPLTLVVAGAGYGKTVAVRHWVEEADRPVAWVSLDHTDDVSAEFWRSVVSALGRAAAVGSAAHALLDRGVRGLKVVNQLLVELSEAAVEAVVVLDDVHVVRSAAVTEELAFFIDRLPPGVRVIATSRVDPPLPLGRWRSTDQLSEVRQNHLAFELDEAIQMFSQQRAPELSVDDMSFLTMRTEGWAAGLHLALLSIRDAPDPHRYIHSALADDRVIADYLIGEVVDHLSDSDRGVVLDLAILDTFDIDLAVAVTERADAADRVRALEARSLLLLPVDEARTTFRFHHLLRELLVHELRWRTPELVPTLHRRAAAHLDATGQTERAAHHHMAAGDFEVAYGLVAAAAYRYIDRGDFAAARRWIGAFPTAFVAEQFERVMTLAVLSIAAGDAAHGHDLLGALASRAPLTSLSVDQQVREASVRSWVELIRGDIEHSELAALRCLDLLDHGGSAGCDVERLPTVLVRLAVHRGNALGAARWLPEVAGQAGASSVLAELHHPALQARSALITGRPEDAERLARLALARAEFLHIGAVAPVVEAHLVLGTLLVQRAELSAAQVHVDTAVDLAEQTRAPLLEAWALMVAVDLAVARLGSAAGLALLAEMRARFELRRCGRGIDELLDAAEARLRIADGDVRGGRQLVGQLRPSAETDLLRARVSMAEGDFGAVVATLEGGPPRTVRQEIEARTLLARSVPPDQADRLVVEAAQLSVRSGFPRIFLQEGSDLLRLGRRALRHTVCSELDELLDHAAADDRTPLLRLEMASLTIRESELLALLPTHLTYREIAGEMYVSLNTVKTYQKSLFRKLGVASRSEAVARAGWGRPASAPRTSNFTRSG